MRLARPDDAEAIAAIYRPIVESTTISFEDVAPGTNEMRARITKTLAQWPWLVSETERGIAGYVYASEHRTRSAYRWSVDVAAYVREDARGRGIASRLYRALFAILELQGFHRAFAGVALPNDASIALHQAVGFEPVGVYREVGFKLGAWHDVSWWARPLARGAAAPGEPRPLPELSAAELETCLALPE